MTTFIIIHKTSAHWESGALPSLDLIAGVRTMFVEWVAAGVFRAAEGLRPSAEGVRLVFSAGERTILPGPFDRGNELPAAFDLIRAASLDEAIAFATREAEVLGDVEIDIRPVMEPWDLGLAAPDPAGRRYMVLRKATEATERGAAPTAAQRTALSRLIDEATRSGQHVASVPMRPSARGRRLLNSAAGVMIYDGPFVETKELVGGYAIVAAASLDAATDLARRYLLTVGAGEADLREVE